MRYALILTGVMTALIAVLAILPPDMVFSPPWLLPALNTVFITLASLTGGVVTRSFRAAGSHQSLAPGGGLFTFGAGQPARRR